MIASIDEPQSALRRYGVAGVCVAAAILLRWGRDHWFDLSGRRGRVWSPPGRELRQGIGSARRGGLGPRSGDDGPSSVAGLTARSRTSCR